MDMYFKQRLFSWLDSYDIYDDANNTMYTVKSELSWGHCLHVIDAAGNHVGTVKEKVLTWLPKFEIYDKDQYVGVIRGHFSLIHPKYDIDFNGWQVTGDVWEWNYTIVDKEGSQVASISKDLWHLTDCYRISVAKPEDALYVLMMVLAIDAQKCSDSAYGD